MIAPLMLSDGLWSTGRDDCQEERDMKVILQMISEKAAQRRRVSDVVWGGGWSQERGRRNFPTQVAG